MAMSDKFWTEVSPSRFPWEKEALEYLRDNLPDHEPWRVWTNFQFIADDGSINEIDSRQNEREIRERWSSVTRAEFVRSTTPCS